MSIATGETGIRALTLEQLQPIGSGDKPSGEILGTEVTHVIADELHVDPVVALQAGEVRTLRPGIDYDRDAVCPGCGCFRDRCACDLREAGVSVKAGKS
jgi:hypothetical protein